MTKCPRTLGIPLSLLASLQLNAKGHRHSQLAGQTFIPRPPRTTTPFCSGCSRSPSTPGQPILSPSHWKEDLLENLETQSVWQREHWDGPLVHRESATNQFTGGQGVACTQRVSLGQKLSGRTLSVTWISLNQGGKAKTLKSSKKCFTHAHAHQDSHLCLCKH